MKMSKLILFGLIKGYAKVVNMYFLIVISYREQNCSLTILYNFMKFI